MRLATCFLLWLSLLPACRPRGGDSDLAQTQAQAKTVRAGYVDFIEPNRMTWLRSLLPKVTDSTTQSILDDRNTMFYDHKSMVPAYQDSDPSVIGVRANSAGLAASRIAKGERIFSSKGFHFPFAKTAGLDETRNTYVLTFWKPPVKNGYVLPVNYWIFNNQYYKNRWVWVFPVGTVFGEVMFQSLGKDEWVPFEVRTRTRYKEGWDTEVFRPFPTAEDLVKRMKEIRPTWSTHRKKVPLFSSLVSTATLKAASISSRHFPSTFPAVKGALDELPAIGDKAIVKELLTTTAFRSASGSVWKRNGSLETYAAATKVSPSIVPIGYKGGLIPVNELSCKRCHQDAGRPFGIWSFPTTSYGEIWGEDEIFSWHPFDPAAGLFGTFDRNRRANPRLVQAGLIKKVSSRQMTGDYVELKRKWSRQQRRYTSEGFFGN